MALHDIPVLSGGHPLFDWDDYPESYAALVSQGDTPGFTKEAWNAIVDAVYDALIAGGESWDADHTSYAGARITESYGELSADMFNSVRHNIDHPAPLGWAWAWNPEFRGYVGRENFRGFYAHGADSDDVYPEYIIELARKANLLIEIMRGSANISEARYKELITTLYQARVLPRRSAPAEHKILMATSYHAPVLARRSAPLEAKRQSGTRYTGKAEARRSAPVAARLRSEAKCEAVAEAHRTARVEPSKTLVRSSCLPIPLDLWKTLNLAAQAASGTLHTMDVEQLPPMGVAPKGELVKSRSEAEAQKKPPKVLYARGLSGTRYAASGESKQGVSLSASGLLTASHIAEVMRITGCEVAPPRAVEKSNVLPLEVALVAAKYLAAEIVSATMIAAGMDRVPSIWFSAQASSASSSSAEGNVAEPKTLSARSVSGTRQRSRVELAQPKQIGAVCISGTLCSRPELGTAWYPPVWTNDGLWIRQSHSVTKNENGELVIS